MRAGGAAGTPIRSTCARRGGAVLARGESMAPAAGERGGSGGRDRAGEREGMKWMEAG